jgi:hypothetical protein
MCRTPLNQVRRSAEHRSMSLRAKVIPALLRWRYLLLAIWSFPWILTVIDHRDHGDLIWLELGTRILLHHHAPVGSGPRLDVYANNSVVQMGPPALLFAGPFQWLPIQLGAHLMLDILSLLVIPALWLAELAARSAVGPVRGKALLTGLVVVPLWTVECQRWAHADDVIALLAALAAAVLLSRGRHEVAAGLLLGTGAATKPWAVILLPLLFAYARPQIARAVLAFVLGAMVWWVPFVIADPATVHALGSVSLFMVNEPTWHLVGMTGRAPIWIRPAQLLGGVALALLVVRRVGWPAVPVVALAWRVTVDPYDWPYYVMGPLIAAALWDLVRTSRTTWSSLPWTTLSVAVVEFGVEREAHAAAPLTRLVWFIALTVWVVRSGHQAWVARSPGAITPGGGARSAALESHGRVMAPAAL